MKTSRNCSRSVARILGAAKEREVKYAITFACSSLNIAPIPLILLRRWWCRWILFLRGGFDVGGGAPGGDGAGVAGGEVWNHVADGGF